MQVFSTLGGSRQALDGRLPSGSRSPLASALVPKRRRRQDPPGARTIRRRRLGGPLSGLVLCAVVVLIAVVAGAGPASAHATLIATVPAGDELLSDVPTEVQLQFDEPVDVVEGGVRVFGPDGSRVDQGQVNVEGSTLIVPIDAGGEGTYTIAWRALSEDNHNLESSFVFHVGTSTGAAQIDGTDGQVGDAIGAVGRLLALGGMLVLFGTAVIRLLNCA
jgi:copper transport protein